MSNDKYISDYIPAPIAKNENQRLEAVKRTGACIWIKMNFMMYIVI